MTRKGTAFLSAIVASVAFAVPAHSVADPVDLDNCLVTQIDPNANLCDGYFVGLNTDGNPADSAFLESVLNGWGLSSSPEYKDDNTASGTSTTSLFDAVATSGGGSFTLLAPLSGAFAVAIKAGQYLGLFYFDSTRSFASGDIFTFSIPDMDKGEGLSHVSIFGGTTRVPEPTTLALLGLGLAGLGLSRRRK